MTTPTTRCGCGAYELSTGQSVMLAAGSWHRAGKPCYVAGPSDPPMGGTPPLPVEPGEEPAIRLPLFNLAEGWIPKPVRAMWQKDIATPILRDLYRAGVEEGRRLENEELALLSEERWPHGEVLAEEIRRRARERGERG